MSINSQVQQLGQSDYHTGILADQVRYYRARAAEYDQWFLRQGRYDHGAAHTASWNREVDEVRAELAELAPLGEALELACGTGLWTWLLADMATKVTAVDASPEVIALNTRRLTEAGTHRRVDYVEADLFQWRPARQYDFVFFGFWLSHVPDDEFDAFWGRVENSLNPGGRVFFVDSLPVSSSKAAGHPPDTAGKSVRELGDGRRFTIVKVFYDPTALERRLGQLGFVGTVTSTDTFFLHGCLRRR